jgi:hypothetical protein
MVRSDLEVPPGPHRANRVTRDDPVAPGTGLVNQATTDRGVRAGLVDQATTDREVRAGQHPVGQVVLALPATPADQVVPADRAGPDPTDRAARVGPADRAAPAHGMGTPSTATSTEPHGETDPHLGVMARRRGRAGAARFRHRVASGSVAQLTTGATRKPPSGIRTSTSGASISSESGFRCKESP